MSRLGPKMMELVRALVVLALVFLNFGHVPVAVGAGLLPALGAASFCGDPIDSPDGDAAAAPCPVCVIGSGMALPPPPPAFPLHLAGDSVRHRPAAPVVLAAWRCRDSQPRAPPALA